MSQSAGYVNSQTWEAWYESWVVVCGNVSLVLVLSFLLSVAAAATVYLLPVLHQPQLDEANQTQLDKDVNSKANSVWKKTDGDTDQDLQYEETNGISQSQKAVLEVMNATSDNNCSLPREGLRKRKEEPSRLSPFYQRKEKEVTNEQLSTIHRLMQEQKDKFGDTSMEDLVDQLKLYSS